MAELTIETAEQIITTLGQNEAALTECLSQCLEETFQIRLGETGGWSLPELAEPFTKAGVITMFDIGGQGAAVLIPATLPLPDWYTAPNETQKSRLQTLAMEWAMNLFPADLEPSKSVTIAVTELGEFVSDCQPAEGAATALLEVTNGQGHPCGPLLMVWPLTKPQFSAGVFAPQPRVAPPPKATGPISTAGGRSIPMDEAPASPAAAPEVPAATATYDPLMRLRRLPVEVSVRLAEKRIPVSQLLGITAGTLITFNKSCEDLLELYINNSLYCRGEAVKIGENFGLKINEVNSTRERVSKILG